MRRLAEEFNRIEINTDRLRRAKAHFEQGEIAAARAVFDSEREQMQDENNRLVREKDRYEKDVLLLSIAFAIASGVKPEYGRYFRGVGTSERSDQRGTVRRAVASWSRLIPTRYRSSYCTDSVD